MNKLFKKPDWFNAKYEVISIFGIHIIILNTLLGIYLVFHVILL
jgi:hypothetical protein